MPATNQRPASSSGAFSRLARGNAGLFGIAAVVLALDRLTKAAVVETMPHGASESVVDGFFNLVHTRNTGIAFSLFADSAPWFRNLALPALSIAAIAIIFLMLRQREGVSSAGRVALALILAGAVGNLYDRVAYGYVTDFLDFYIASYHWPAFNVADSAITVGAVLLVLDSLRGKGPVSEAAGAA